MKKLVFFLTILLTTVQLGYSQTYVNNSGNQSEALIQRNLEKEMSAGQETNTSNDNAVNIKQIGANNDITISSFSNTSLLSIQQTGFDNSMFLKISADNLLQNVIQLGDNHRYVDFTRTERNYGLNLLQQGNGQNLIIHEGNKISENMTLKMNGDSQSIVIRNFN